MDYKKLYFQYIDFVKTKNRIKSKEIYESHHIIPKCLGGSGKKTEYRTHPNIILLTPKEHFLAHLFLIKIYPENKDVEKAFYSMSNYYNLNSRQYQKIKENKPRYKWYTNGKFNIKVYNNIVLDGFTPGTSLRKKNKIKKQDQFLLLQQKENKKNKELILKQKERIKELLKEIKYSQHIIDLKIKYLRDTNRLNDCKIVADNFNEILNNKYPIYIKSQIKKSDQYFINQTLKLYIADHIIFNKEFSPGNIKKELIEDISIDFLVYYKNILNKTENNKYKELLADMIKEVQEPNYISKYFSFQDLDCCQ